MTRDEILAPRSAAIREKCNDLLDWLEAHFEERGASSLSMTEATVGIMGTSGRGCAVGVRKLEVLADLGLLTITRTGKRTRAVSLAYPAQPGAMARMNAKLGFDMYRSKS